MFSVIYNLTSKNFVHYAQYFYYAQNYTGIIGRSLTLDITDAYFQIIYAICEA